MEQIVFPVPHVCGFLTRETMDRVWNATERDDQGSKVGNFFGQVEDMYREMVWQKKMRGWLMTSSKLFCDSTTTCLYELPLCLKSVRPAWPNPHKRASQQGLTLSNLQSHVNLTSM